MDVGERPAGDKHAGLGELSTVIDDSGLAQQVIHIYQRNRRSNASRACLAASCGNLGSGQVTIPIFPACRLTTLMT